MVFNYLVRSRPVSVRTPSFSFSIFYSFGTFESPNAIMSLNFDKFRQEAIALGLVDPQEIKAYIRESQALALEEELKIKQFQKDEEIKIKQFQLEEDLKRREIELELQIRAKAAEDQSLLSTVCQNKELELKEMEYKAKIMSIQVESDLKVQTANSHIKNESERLALELQIKQNEAENQNASVSNSSFAANTLHVSQGVKNILSMPSLKSSDRDDIEIFFSHFSHACDLNEIPHGDRSKLLINKLPVNLASIVDRMSLTDAADIDKVQTAIFSKFLLDAEYFKSKFYSLVQLEGESSSQFFQRLREILTKWLAAEKVPETYQDLVDFLLKNQYMRKLNTQKSIFIRERDPESLEDLCKVSDLYDKANLFNKSNRFNYQNNSQTAHSQLVQSSQNSHFNQTNRPEVKINTSANKNKESVKCDFCSKPGHSQDKCFKRLGRPNSRPAGPQNSSTMATQKNKFKAAAAMLPCRSRVVENLENERGDTVTANIEATNPKGQEVSLLELNSDETKIMAAYTVKNLNHDEDRSDILNPYTQALILPDRVQVRAMRDTGSFVSVIKASLVPENAYTSRKISVKFANGSVDSYPTAIIEIRSKFFNGKLEAAVMTEPVCDLILGNQANIKTCFDPMPQPVKKIRDTKIKNQDEMSKVEHVAELTKNDQEDQNNSTILNLESARFVNNVNCVAEIPNHVPSGEFTSDNKGIHEIKSSPIASKVRGCRGSDYS